MKKMKNMKKDFIQELKDLHYELRSLFETKEYDKVNKKLKSLQSEDINCMKTALILFQGCKDLPAIAKEYKGLQEVFDKKLSEL